MVVATLLAVSDFGSAMELLSQYGPFVGLLVLACAFNIWRDWKREARLTKRVEVLEEKISNTLIPIITENNAVITRVTTVMERLEKHLD